MMQLFNGNLAELFHYLCRTASGNISDRRVVSARDKTTNNSSCCNLKFFRIQTLEAERQT